MDKSAAVRFLRSALEAKAGYVLGMFTSAPENRRLFALGQYLAEMETDSQITALDNAIKVICPACEANLGCTGACPALPIHDLRNGLIEVQDKLRAMMAEETP